MTTGKIIQADAINGIVTKPNLVPNSSAILNTLGWTEGSYTAGTRPTGTFTASSGSGTFAVSRTTTSPLGDTGTSIVFTKSSGNQQGRAIQTEFALPLEYRAKVLQLKNAYINTSTNATDFVAGSSTTDSDMIFYAAFSTDGGSTYSVAEPSSFKLLSNSKDISDYFDGSIQTPYNATHMRLIAYVASTSTTAWSIKTTASVSPSTYVFGTPITDWQSYTPTGSWTTNTTYAGKYRRVGDTMEGNIILLLSGAPNAATLSASIPSGYSIDTSKLIDGGANNVVGQGWFLDSGTRTDGLWTVIFNSTTVQPIWSIGSGSNGITNTNPITWANNDRININFSVPILGWSSSVQMSDSADTRVVDFVGSKVASQAVTSGTTAYTFTSIRDSHGAWNGTDTYVIPVPGDYIVSLSCTAVAVGTYSAVYINGIQNAFVNSVQVANARGSGSNIIPNLKAGDLLTIRSVGTSTTISGTTGDNLSISRISGPSTIASSETVSARYSTGAGQSIANGTLVIVDYGTKSFDSHGSVTTGASWKFTAQSTGKFKVKASLLYAAANFTAGNGINFFIYKNGSLYSSYVQRVEATLSGITPSVLAIDDVVDMVSGDFIDIRTSHGEATARTIHTVANYNFVTVERIGN